MDYFESRKIKFTLETMDDLGGQIVEHFPTEHKVFSKNNEILKEHTFFKGLFSNSLRNLGLIVMVQKHAGTFISVFIIHVKKWASKPTAHPLQNLSQALP